jgi:hypothetical protein
MSAQLSEVKRGPIAGCRYPIAPVEKILGNPSSAVVALAIGCDANLVRGARSYGLSNGSEGHVDTGAGHPQAAPVSVPRNSTSTKGTP